LSCSICARSRSSCARSSGVNASPKSSASNTGRISSTLSSPVGFGQRLAHSIASSMERTSQIQKPATSSLVSANGPSITRRFGPENSTRTPLALGCSPSPPFMMPACTSASL